MFNKYIQVIVAAFISTGLSAQTGTVRGTISTSDGKPGEFVSVAIKESGKGTITDADGVYELKNITRGTHTIVAALIGLQTKEIIAVVKPGETTSVDFVLSENSEQLQEVVVSSAANRYSKNQVSSSLRLNAPIIEVPQNIQLVSSEALKDQQVISMSDGLVRNVSGAVRMEHWGDLYANISMRGSQIQAFRNGFNVVNSYWGPLTEDMSFVDHIEFVKGPAGFMLANGDPSGLYNVVTKKPTGVNKGEASLTMGSYDLFRSTLDLDGKLTRDGKLLFRLNVAAQNKKSHRAFEYNNRYVIAPVISYQLDQNTKLTLEYNFQKAKMSDVGSFYVFGPDGYATLGRNFTALSPGLPSTDISDHSIYFNLEHRINNEWKVTAQISRFNYLQNGTSMWPSVVNPDGTMIRSIGSWDAKSVMSMGQVFLNGDVRTGFIRHRVLAGIDMANKEYFADWGQSHALDTAGAEFDPAAPNYGVPVNGYPDFDESTPLEQRAQMAGGLQDQQYTAGYVQDELGFFENRVRLTLAGRYTYVKQSDFGGAPKMAEKFTPRTGLSFSINKNLAVYALYDQAFIPQNGKLANGEKVQPITGQNAEFGVKKAWFDQRWNSSVSVYRITKNNELTADPYSPPTSGLSIELGQKVSEGVEFDLRGQIVPGLNLITNYAYTDSRITKLAPGVSDMKVGDIVPGFARHTANVWLTYTIQRSVLKGFGLSGGLMYLGDRRTYWDPSPDNYMLPNYLKIDGGIFYEREHLRITCNVFNILNEYLYAGSYYKWLNAYYWQTEPGRNFRLTLNYRF